LTSLVKKIDQQLAAVAGKTANPLGVYVIFVNNADGLDKRLREMAEKEGLKHVNLCIGVPPAVSAAYEVAPEADVTAVIYSIARRGQPVTANFALRKGELDKAKTKAIVKALSEMLPK